MQGGDWWVDGPQRLHQIAAAAILPGPLLGPVRCLCPVKFKAQVVWMRLRYWALPALSSRWCPPAVLWWPCSLAWCFSDAFPALATGAIPSGAFAAPSAPDAAPNGPASASYSASSCFSPSYPGQGRKASALGQAMEPPAPYKRSTLVSGASWTAPTVY